MGTSDRRGCWGQGYGRRSEIQVSAGSAAMTSTPLEVGMVCTGRLNLVQSFCGLRAFRGTILAFAERDLPVQRFLGIAWCCLLLANAT